MNPQWPGISGTPGMTAVLRQYPEDFRVYEQLGFEPSGEGEHVFLHLEKQSLNTQDLLQRIARLSAIPARDIGISGMKDRNAITCQWFSVRMAGKAEPDWYDLEREGDVRILALQRHLRKLKRGVHKANRFTLRLRDVQGDKVDFQQRLEHVSRHGLPNYFGEQRFGRNGSTLEQALQWMDDGGRKISRTRRSLYLSALRAFLFNSILADRINRGDWDRVLNGDVCVLNGTRSLFTCERADDESRRRAADCDIHPGLPLWGAGESLAGPEQAQRQVELLTDESKVKQGAEICHFLERMGLELAYRPARVLPDDFCWQFCDDGTLELKFKLASGSYATAVLAELVQYIDVRQQRVVTRGECSE